MLLSLLKSYPKKIINSFIPGNLVFMYHRINEAGLDPWKIKVTPENFEDHLRILNKYANPVPLSEIVTPSEKSPKKKAVAVTFDDGYADNLYNAKPLLESYSIPATFFISTGHIGSSGEFWWDDLEHKLLQPGILPGTLCFELNGNKFKWELGKAVNYSSQEYKQDSGKLPWLSAPGTRLNFYYTVWQKLFPLKDDERNILLDQISKWSGINEESRESHRILSFREMLSLADNNLFEIGAHGTFHPVMPEHTSDYQIKDIRESKRFLEEAFRHKVTSFAYPHGEYSDETPGLLQSEGFTSACTTDHGSIRAAFDPFRIPRIQIQNWDKNNFLNLLKKWFYQ